MIYQLKSPYENYYYNENTTEVYSIVHPKYTGHLYRLSPVKHKSPYVMYRLSMTHLGGIGRGTQTITQISLLRSDKVYVGDYIVNQDGSKTALAVELAKPITATPGINFDSFSSIVSNQKSEPVPTLNELDEIKSIPANPNRFKRLTGKYSNFVYDTTDKNLYSLKTGNMRLLKRVPHRKEEGWQITSPYQGEFVSVEFITKQAETGTPYIVESVGTYMLTKNGKPIMTALSEFDLQTHATTEMRIFPGKYEIWEKKGEIQHIPETIQYIKA